jgi:hypothetical protein
MSNISLVTKFKLVQAFAPKTTNAALTSQVITVKHAIKVWLVLHFTNAVGFASVPTIKQATDIAAGTNAAGPTCRIWLNEDTATTDTLVAQTAAASQATDAVIKNKMVVFEIDPASLTDGYDCVYCTIATSSQATNFVSGEWVIQTNYQQATPPSAILD